MLGAPARSIRRSPGYEMPGPWVKDWKLYHKLLAQGYSKEEAAKIANAAWRRRRIAKRRNPLVLGEDWERAIEAYEELLTKRGRERFQRLLEQSGGEGNIRQRQLAEMFAHAYRVGGRAASVTDRLIFDFTPDRGEALRFAERQAATLLTNSDEEQRRLVRKTVHRAMEEGWTQERLRRQLKRVLGLTARQEQSLRNFEAQLIQSGMKPSVVQRRTREFLRRLKGQRAEVVARTELRTALEAGKLRYWNELADRGIIRRGDSWRVWHTQRDERTCWICAPLDGKKARLGGKFKSVLGPIPGPPPHPNCRCWTTLETRVLIRELAA